MDAKCIEIGGETFTLRVAAEDDRRFVFATWCAAARELRNVRRSVFDVFYPVRVQRFLSETPVHVLASRADTLVAWACGRESDTLHFAYVPAHLRGHGLGRAVVESVLGGYPERVWVTSSPLSIANHRRFVFNPFL
jgi:predicted GNAT family acetyltransferase